VAWADVQALHIPNPALLNQRAPNIFTDVITDQAQRDPVPAAKVSEGLTNIIARTERENVTPMRGQVKIGLTIPIL
jgi:hypothetical protein